MAGRWPPAWRRCQGGEKAGTDIPNYILADGPVITKETAPGHLWLQKNFLI